MKVKGVDRRISALWMAANKRPRKSQVGPRRESSSDQLGGTSWMHAALV